LSQPSPNFRLPSPGGIAFEVRAGQIVEQHLEIGLKQILPAITQKREEVLLVRGQLVQATIETIGKHEREILAAQVTHRALIEPLPMQPPFAARRDQLIARQRLQNVQPTRALARGSKRLGAKIVQPKLIPEDHGQPARAPLTWAPHSHPAQPDRRHIAVERRRDAILGKQRDLGRLPALVERIYRAAPRRTLAVAYLPEIKNLPLNHTPALDAAVLDHRPGPMLLAVLAANLLAQKHAPESRLVRRRARALVGTSADFQILDSIKSTACRAQRPRKS